MMFQIKQANALEPSVTFQLPSKRSYASKTILEISEHFYTTSKPLPFQDWCDKRNSDERVFLLDTGVSKSLPNSFVKSNGGWRRIPISLLVFSVINTFGINNTTDSLPDGVRKNLSSFCEQGTVTKQRAYSIFSHDISLTPRKASIDDWTQWRSVRKSPQEWGWRHCCAVTWLADMPNMQCNINCRRWQLRLVVLCDFAHK